MALRSCVLRRSALDAPDTPLVTLCTCRLSARVFCDAQASALEQSGCLDAPLWTLRSGRFSLAVPAALAYVRSCAGTFCTYAYLP